MNIYGYNYPEGKRGLLGRLDEEYRFHLDENGYSYIFNANGTVINFESIKKYAERVRLAKISNKPKRAKSKFEYQYVYDITPMDDKSPIACVVKDAETNEFGVSILNEESNTFTFDLPNLETYKGKNGDRIEIMIPDDEDQLIWFRIERFSNKFDQFSYATARDLAVKNIGKYDPNKLPNRKINLWFSNYRPTKLSKIISNMILYWDKPRDEQ